MSLFSIFHLVFHPKSSILYLKRENYRSKWKNVWAVILWNKIVGPFLINGKLTSKEYIDLLDSQVIPKIENIVGIEFDKVWFQQDGAQCNFSLLEHNLLNIIFPRHSVGRRGATEWLPSFNRPNPSRVFLLELFEKQSVRSKTFKHR